MEYIRNEYLRYMRKMFAGLQSSPLARQECVTTVPGLTTTTLPGGLYINTVQYSTVQYSTVMFYS